jgi:hypothetical protein
MSDTETPPEGRSWGKTIWWGLKVGVVIILLMFSELFSLLEIPLRVLFGWLFYLVEVIPRTQINVELLTCSLGALLLGMAGMQYLMSRLHAANRWPWRWTLAWCAMLVVMFSTSIAAVGIVHQVGWLFRLPVWIEWSGMGTQMKAANNAKQMVLAARQYASEHDGKLPDTCAEMMPEIVSDSRIFWATVDRGMPLEPLVYAGAGIRDTGDGSLLVVWSPRPSSSGRRVIARLDGSAELVREDKFQEMLAAYRERLFQHNAAAGTPR